MYFSVISLGHSLMIYGTSIENNSYLIETVSTLTPIYSNSPTRISLLSAVNASLLAAMNSRGNLQQRTRFVQGRLSLDEDEGRSVFLCNMWNQTPHEEIWHPGRLKSLITMLWKPQKSKIHYLLCTTRQSKSLHYKTFYNTTDLNFHSNKIISLHIKEQNIIP